MQLSQWPDRELAVPHMGLEPRMGLEIHMGLGLRARQGQCAQME